MKQIIHENWSCVPVLRLNQVYYYLLAIANIRIKGSSESISMSQLFINLYKSTRSVKYVKTYLTQEEHMENLMCVTW